MGKKSDIQLVLKNHVSGQSNKPLSKPAHALSADQVISELHTTTDDGLTTVEAKKRHAEYGNNQIGDAGGVNATKILIRQIANAMILVLILAMAVSYGIGSYIEGGVVTAVIILNIVIGFGQECQAEKTMDSLRNLASPTAVVIRDGNEITISNMEVVPGDVIVLKTGDTVPADLRLFEALNFETDEALLTGESLPVRKEAEEIFDEDTGPGDRLNVAYASSTVTKGRARGVVFATGMFTEIGSIAAALRGSESRVRPVRRNSKGYASPRSYAQAWGLTAWDAFGRFLGVNVGTPLQKKLSRLACLLFGIAVVCAIIVLAANRFSNNTEVIIYAVGTGLSMIPASLIVVLTITMAAGTKRMVERNVIVRNMKALEALGAVTDICSDKTGTITQGKMVAKKAWIPAKGTYSVGDIDEPFNPTKGGVTFDALPPTKVKKSAFSEKGEGQDTDEMLNDNQYLKDFLYVAALANLANIHKGEDGNYHARGDPTEIAIQVFASRFGWGRPRWTTGQNPTWKQIAEYPFDSDVKRMSVLFKNLETEKDFVFTKGAVERIVAACSMIHLKAGQDAVPINEEIEKDILENMEAMASQGLRVLALASRHFEGEYSSESEIDRGEIEKNLTFRGLIGLYDPPRLESARSVKSCQNAGIIVHMLTGDHPGTAAAIAKEVGILPARMKDYGKEMQDAMVMTASQFDKLSDDEIDALPVLPLVIARCAPNTKVRMIDALHRRKAFAAMTGDGVNDSPSLKRADVGIAMGQSGSDVAKDASDIVLTDDNFASILNAIEEGRRMFDNIKKFILHLLAQNVAQAIILLVGLVFKDSDDFSVFPITPVEIMWIIMVTSSFPDMGLGFEPASADILQRPPHNLKRGVFTIEVMIDTVVYGVWIAALCLSSFVLVVYGPGDDGFGVGCNDAYSSQCDTVFRARATAFACLTWFSLFLAWEMMHMRRSFFRMRPDSPHYLTQWIREVWANKFLFWSVIAGFVTIFPIIYIPGLNRVVFKHESITWEWAIVVVATILFFAGIETWKFGKRVYFRRIDKKTWSGDKHDLEGRTFERYFSGMSDAGKIYDSNKKPPQ
ncbi:potassium/sodium efflux P-type ATPase, fungal-type [Verruconis gallopava]|uniref:P-type Na(+) transporter n=1 Tax=Verruconis gallopava TaxID=253628 RepID=A0A0D2A1Z1_9PEZI|nr:potassium/sodium efflux P-type ATPase, fungal-type [Verruconis gallopava]KIW00778.1 potassium/sodium efflux P-type ATPase, fungal-type [Verruconis gallopava]